MENLLIGLLDTTLDYSTVGKVILVYLVSLWAMFSLWVFVDARRRFDNNFYAAIFFLLVFIFNFPALIFYIIVRPENVEEYINSNDSTLAGLNIPVANFVDQNGNLEFSLNIKLNSNSISSDSVKVNIEGKKLTKVIKYDKPTIDVIKNEPVNSSKFSHKLKSKANEIKGNALKISKNFLKEMKSYGDKIEKSDDNIQNDKEKTSIK